MPTKDRIFGLDLLRAGAVLLVVFHHSLSYVQVPQWFSSIGFVGEIGVGSLLVLSGYLIGQGLIRKSREGRFTTFAHLGQFYSRRWWRTLPPYYFCLFVMAALFPPFLAQLAAHKSFSFSCRISPGTCRRFTPRRGHWRCWNSFICSSRSSLF